MDQLVLGEWMIERDAWAEIQRFLKRPMLAGIVIGLVAVWLSSIVIGLVACVLALPYLACWKMRRRTQARIVRHFPPAHQ